MIRNFLTQILGLVMACQCVNAQNGNYNLGARSMGIGESSVAVSDQWALFNNIAGIASEKSTSLLASYRNRFGVGALSTFGAGLIHPMSFGVIGIQAFRFGDELLSEQKIGLSIGSKIGLVSLGATTNMIQYKVLGFGSKRLFSIDFGGIVSFSENFYFGALITNINQAKISNLENEHLPTIMRAGISYYPVKGLMLNVEIEKDLDFAECFKLGLEYQFIRKFFARTGFQTQPFLYSFGLGFKTNKFDTAYAFASNPHLGDVHEISVVYLFGSKS